MSINKHSLKAAASIITQMGHAFINLFYGIWHLHKLDQAPVTLFAGSMLEQDNVFMHDAIKLTKQLLASQIPVLSSGCPGVIKYGHCNKLHHKISFTTIVISKTITEHHNLTIYRFFARKWLLITYSKAFVVFPGGFGTLGELAETLTLLQTKLRFKAPVILIGTVYWQPFMQWVEQSALRLQLINPQDIAFITVTDSIDQALAIIKKLPSQALDIESFKAKK